MAYFSALGGTGGTSATITVTYSEDFYGTTITATNGTTTLTKTATSSGEVVFTVSEGGTWIVSGVVEGSTYSEQVDVTFEYTTPQLIALPDGSTATPVNSIAMWLKCAMIRDKDYTTLSQVLADTETFIALCADSNACDYMTRSTNWASGVAADSTAMLIVGKYNYCANKLLSNSTWASAIGESAYMEYVLDAKVPTMTSNTTPSGEVIHVNEVSGYEAWHSFSYATPGFNVSIGWLANNNSGGSAIGYKFDIATLVNTIKIWLPTASTYRTHSATFTVQASNDGTNWVELGTGTIPTGVSITVLEVNLQNTNRYTRYRLLFASGQYVYTEGSTQYVFLGAIQFYGRTDNANYIPLVPRMTDNTHPSGVASASSSYNNNYLPYMAFNGSMNNFGWLPANDTNQYIDYEFDTPTIVRMLGAGYYYGGSQGLQVTVKIQGTNGGSFEDITDNLTFSAQNSFDFFNFSNDVAYKKYRILLISTTVSHFYNIGDGLKFQFYRESDLPIIHSAVEDNIFYMDDGSPVALCGIPVGDTIDVDMESFKGQTLTLVSTVAKDPTNLSNDFTMPVRITPNITEIYLMPYGALYWWGNNRGVSEYTTSAISSSASTKGTVTFNKQSVIMYNPATSRFSQIASDNTIDFTDYTALKCIGNDGNVNGMEHGVANTSHTLITGYSQMWTQDTTTRLYTLDITSCTATGYAYVANPYYSGTGTCYALWFE